MVLLSYLKPSSGLGSILFFLHLLGALNHLLLVTFICLSKVKYSKITNRPLFWSATEVLESWDANGGMLTLKTKED